jgi:nucleotide-binding universal stress UspA family protein
MSQHVTVGSSVQLTTVRKRVLAGFDGSAGAEQAVQWAAREAARRGALLHIVMARTAPDGTDVTGVAARHSADLVSLAERISELYPLLDVDISSTVDSPRDVLLTEARSADLLTVGADHDGVAGRLLHGSVARTATRRSPCPVVVVRGDDVTRPIRTVAIGVDGSSAADAALDWAVEEAALHGASIVVVHAWEREGPLADAQRVLNDAVEECRRRAPGPVRGEIFNGDATTGLIAASLEVELLAIGSRGRSGFRTTLFGSVALAVAERAACPVGVTHPGPRPI